MVKKHTRKQSHYEKLKKKWLKQHKVLEKKLLAKHKEALHALTLVPKQQLIGTLMLTTAPFISPTLPATLAATPTQEVVAPHVTQAQLVTKLKENLPATVQPLTPTQEGNIASILSYNFNVHVTPILQGIRLNTTYGLIGQEQHLRRYPGDSTDQQFDTPEDAALYASEGTAPGLGAWGYFANSRESMTEQDKLRERYYIAVQTFLAPGWNEHVGEYGLFFKYRKMLVVNPDNGRAIVADIADAGPAPWTGKQLGGSPEVMHYLQRVDGAQKGPVLYFFLDDPNDTIPLGPRSL